MKYLSAAGLGADLFAALGELRGTPVGLVVVLLGLALAGWTFWRGRRRRRARRRPADTSSRPTQTDGP